MLNTSSIPTVRVFQLFFESQPGKTLYIPTYACDLFVFSGKQMHGVYPFRTKDGKGERRSIAFNATVKTNFGEVAMKETAVGSAIEEKFMEEEKSK